MGSQRGEPGHLGHGRPSMGEGAVVVVVAMLFASSQEEESDASAINVHPGQPTQTFSFDGWFKWFCASKVAVPLGERHPFSSAGCTHRPAAESSEESRKASSGSGAKEAPAYEDCEKPLSARPAKGIFACLYGTFHSTAASLI